MIRIYHNPRWRKSREGLALIEKSGHPFEVVKYLEAIPTKQELTQVLILLGYLMKTLFGKTKLFGKKNSKEKNYLIKT